MRPISISLALALAVLSADVDAFSSSSSSSSLVGSSIQTQSSSQLEAAVSQSQSRRAALSSVLSIATTTLVGIDNADAGLLDDYGTDPTTDKQPEKKTTEQAKNKGKAESTMEPNLRSNYYYPTNKVRYLPRIKKCSDAIPSAAQAIGLEDWDTVRDFANVVADDTILPMQLYVSSLTGGGTSVKVAFAKEMLTAAKIFAKQQKILVKSVEKRDAAKSSEALELMSEAMLAYRTSGRLLGPDAGGDIPSVDEIRRSTKRSQRGEAFEAKVKERDARVKAATEAAAGN